MAPGTPEYGSDVIVEMLRALGIEYAAFNPGSSFRGIHDSLVNYAGNNPQVIECTHEEISVAIAHGYAKAAGKPMAAIVHDVVGLQHASMAIYNAWCDRVPVVVLGGTGPMDATRRRPWIDWIHTANVQGSLVRDYTKFDDQPATLAAVPEALIRAVQLAVAPPGGPVYVCFDVDLQEASIAQPLVLPDVSAFSPPLLPGPDPAVVPRVLEWLVHAERPVLIADRVGFDQRAVDALVELSELLALPVIGSPVSLNFPTLHPLNFSEDAGLAAEADVVLGLECRDLFGA
ncbi:MAG: thiamine pyrophosphate-binding protein, partial [Chloroflexota bacterium]